MRLPAQHTHPNRSDRLPAGRHPLHYMPRPDLGPCGVPTVGEPAVCTRGTKAKQVFAGFALAANCSRCLVAAILAADVVGYSRLVHEDESGATQDAAEGSLPPETIGHVMLCQSAPI